MTQFNIGDRLRLSAQAKPERRAVIGDMHGTITSLNEWGPGVDWGTPTPKWGGPSYYEIELVPEPSLAETLRAKATAKRAEAEEAQAKTDALAREWDAQSDRAITLRQEATALNAAAKILETL